MQGMPNADVLKKEQQQSLPFREDRKRGIQTAREALPLNHACTMRVSMIGEKGDAFCHACIRLCCCVLSLGGLSTA